MRWLRTHLYGPIVMFHADYWTNFDRLREKYRTKAIPKQTGTAEEYEATLAALRNLQTDPEFMDELQVKIDKVRRDALR